MTEFTLYLAHGHVARCQTDKGYGFVDDLRGLASTGRSRFRHLVGQDGSDIYVRPCDIVMLEIDA